MKKYIKTKIGIAVILFVVISAGIFVWKFERIKEKFAAFQVRDEKQDDADIQPLTNDELLETTPFESEKKDATEQVIPETPKVTEESEKIEEEKSEISSPQVVVPENVVSTKSDPKKKIKCSLDAKKGSHNDKAIVSWECEHYIGWKCDLKVQTTKGNDKNVILPASSKEVGVMKAMVELVPYCPKGIKPPNPTCVYRDAKVPGYTWYHLVCESDDGREKTFSEYYTNNKS